MPQDCDLQQRKAASIAQMLLAAKAERDTAEEARKRMEVKFCSSDKGLALLKVKYSEEWDRKSEHETWVSIASQAGTSMDSTNAYSPTLTPSSVAYQLQSHERATAVVIDFEAFRFRGRFCAFDRRSLGRLKQVEECSKVNLV